MNTNSIRDGGIPDTGPPVSGTGLSVSCHSDAQTNQTKVAQLWPGGKDLVDPVRTEVKPPPVPSLRATCYQLGGANFP